MNPSIEQHFTSVSSSLLAQTSAWLPQFVTGLIIYLAAWLLARGLQAMVMRIVGHSKSRRTLYQLVARTIKVAILLIGAVTALGTMGINVTALVTSLGLAGFALGFALKDALSNLLAGFLVLFYQPFKLGNIITVSGTTGEVVDINLRYTVIKTPHDNTLIPNATILNNPVKVDFN